MSAPNETSGARGSQEPNNLTPEGPQSSLLEDFYRRNEDSESVDPNPARSAVSHSETANENDTSANFLFDEHPAASSSSGPGGSSSLLDLESQNPPSRFLSIKQRVSNVFNHFIPIKQTYERINNGITTGRMQANIPGNFVGQGTDGVFRNLMAKPDTDAERQGQETHPPTYEEAAADATPEYWELTVILPMYEDEVFVEGLPVGNIANFVWNGLVTVAFQFVGFVLCYLLHTSHAAKQGSRGGLGITFIIYGVNMIPQNTGYSDKLPTKYIPDDANAFQIDKNTSIKKGSSTDSYKSSLYLPASLGENTIIRTPYFAYGVIAFGIFIIIKACADFWKVKQIELSILAPTSTQTTTTSTTSATEVRESTESDRAIFAIGEHSENESDHENNENHHGSRWRLRLYSEMKVTMEQKNRDGDIIKKIMMHEWIELKMDMRMVIIGDCWW